MIRNTNYQKALDFRSQGMTYGEIRKEFGIAKSTQSSWFKNLQLKGKAARVLKTKQGENMGLLAKFNRERHTAIGKENEDIRLLYESLIGDLSYRDILLIGAVLYWGEGRKSFRNKKGYHIESVAFSNSDPMMILMFIYFLEKVLGLRKENIRASVIIHPNILPIPSINYWSNLTKIPKEKFRCYTAISRASKMKRPKNSLPYGTLQILANGRKELFKIKGLIDGIIKTVK